MIPTYRTDPDLLQRAIESVLDARRGAGEMEIVVVNDDPDDDLAAPAAKFGDRVQFLTNARNLGTPENFNECIRRATGSWVHILHGDDAVQPDFYDAYEQAIAANPGCVLVGGQAIVVDEQDRWVGLSPAVETPSAELFGARHPCNFVTTVVARSAYEQAGGFDVRFMHANDWEMWVRIALLGPVAWVPVPHAYYRRHAHSDSAQLQRSDAYVHDCRRAIDALVAQFPDANARGRVRAGALMVLSDYVLGIAAAHAAAGHRRAAIRDACWGVRLRTNPSSIGRALDTIGRALFS
jgi:GT2 family glycosyltransferase